MGRYTGNELKGKIALITGATSGIGKAAAIELARQGASIIMVGRDIIRGNLVVDEVKQLSGSREVRLAKADLSSMSEIVTMSHSLQRQTDHLDILVNNAALVPMQRQITSEGLEMQWAINYFAPFVLTNHLLNLLKKSQDPRIINVSSAAHKHGHIRQEEWTGGASDKKYRPLSTYAATKLANLLFTLELSRRLEGTGVMVNAVHPGVVATNIYRMIPPPVSTLIKLFMLSPEKGAATIIHLASSASIKGITGKYFAKSKIMEPSSQAKDSELAQWLWQESEALLGAHII